MRAKIIVAFFLGSSAVFAAWSVTQFTFNELLENAEELSTPNKKLIVLKNLFQDITSLDQIQRSEAIRNPNKPYTAFHNESKVVYQNIDTLRFLLRDNQIQLSRLDSMEDILIKRERLFLNYLSMRAEMVENKIFSQRIDSLALLIEFSTPKIDSSVITTEKKITTTMVEGLQDETDQAEDDRSFLGKLFGKKRPERSPEQIKYIEEELNIKVDTLAIAMQDSLITEVERIMRNLASSQRDKSNLYLARELELINTNGILINKLLNILHEFENEEVEILEGKQDAAALLVNESIERITYIMLAFFLGTGLFVFLIFIDITKSNKYKKELQKAKEEAEHLGLIKQRFLANMSHEIRTPLQSIIGFIEQLRSTNNPDKESIEIINQSSEHLLQIVNEVLDYSRIESGKLIFENIEFQLKPLLDEVCGNIRLNAKKKNLNMLVNCDVAESTVLKGDSFRLRQVLYNLLGNAVKFTQRGFIRLEIGILEENDELIHLQFSVTDTGSGIMEKDIENIFIQFEQVSASTANKHGGTGLGLSISKAIIESQGGQINVKSIPGEGSVFSFDLKFEKVPFHGQLPFSKQIDTIKSNNANQHVLLVDDDAFIVKLCQTIFKKHNIENSCYLSAEELLEKDWDESIDIVLLDIRMPHISGIELCSTLRKIKGSKLRIVALTAHALADERAVLHQHGFNDILMKPFKENDLLRVLSNENNPTTENNGIEIQKGTDLSSLEKMTNGDATLLQDILLQYKEDTLEDLHSLDNALNENDELRSCEIIHRLAGRTGQIGAYQIADKLRFIEKLLLKKNNFQEVINEIQITKLELKHLLNDLLNKELSEIK
jgi:signal transduction histidine kinase/FixJ family two-component response regulator